jgi:hypothetical protein
MHPTQTEQERSRNIIRSQGVRDPAHSHLDTCNDGYSIVCDETPPPGILESTQELGRGCS